MKTYKKILSAFLALAVAAISFSVGFTSASAAEAAEFSLSVSSESGNKVTVAISLVSGKFNSFDMELVTDATIKKCESIATSQEYKDFRDSTENAGGIVINASKPETKKLSVSTTVEYTKVGAIFFAEFTKQSAAPVSQSNISLNVNTCSQTAAGGEATVVSTKVNTLLPALAGSCGSSAYYRYDGNSKTLSIYGSGAMTDFAARKAPWVSVASQITSVKIEGTVSSIGNTAFMGASALTSITMPATVTKIGNSAFNGCVSLNGINLSKVTTVGDSAFYSCKKIASLDLTAATSIGDSAFVNCTALKTVNLSDKLTKIGSKAFEGCTALEKLTIGRSTAVASDAFTNCPKLTISCWFGSPAYKVAVEKKIKFVLLNEYVIGDVNADGLINSQDALLVLRYSVGDVSLSKLQEKTGDINNDNKRNSIDALYILEISIGSRDALKYQR